MSKSIEEIVGKIGSDQSLPGTKPGRADKVRYVSFERSSNALDLVEDIVWKVDPPLMNGGAAVLGDFVVTTPDGTSFYAIEYPGDVSGWKQQIERSARESGVLSAKIDSEHFVVSDGRSFPLSGCTIEYDTDLATPKM